jgi:Zn-dependent M16 (insulinase) family peptidase
METLTSARFDELLRLRELVAQWRVQREEGVIDHAHLLMMTAASAGLSPAAALHHRWEGLEGLRILQSLDDTLDEEDHLAALGMRLERVRDCLNDASRQLLVVSEGEGQEAIAAALAKCWQAIPNPVSSSSFTPGLVSTISRQGWSTSTQVNFCAKVYPTVAANHPDAPALQALGDFLRNGYLHRTVREQGGAYGVGAGYHADSGTFRLYSYRDPRLAETLEDFDRSLEWLQNAEHTERSLEEAILGVIAAIDRPGSPAGEAIDAFFGNLFGRTPGQRQAFRQGVLQVTLADLKRVASTYLRPERASCAILSNGETLKAQPGLEIVTI